MPSYDRLRIGPAGVPHASRKRSTEDGIKTVASLGLDAMEIEFVRGVKMGEEMAERVRKVAEELDISLSVHAPYFINLNSKEKDKVEASIKRVLDSARIGNIAGAKGVVVHLGYYGDDTPEEVFRKMKEALERIVEVLHKENNPITINPETMGKLTQFGSLEEVVELSKQVPQVLPCVDFAHLHARQKGKFNTYEEFIRALNYIENELGKDALQTMHLHVSGIEYGDKGEKEHLNLRESDFNYKDFVAALKDKGVRGQLIVESPNLEEDALFLKELFYGS